MSSKQERVNRYAQAVWAAMLERWQGALTDAAAAASSDKVAALLNDTGKSAAEKIEALTKQLPKDLPAEVRNLLGVMVEAGDLSLLGDVSAALGNVISGKTSVVKAEIASAVELSDEEKEQIRRQLIAQHGDNLSFSFAVDAALLGGLRVRVGDSLIDTSVASRLTALRESLTSVVR